VKYTFIKIIDTYKDKNFKSAIFSGNEIDIKCDSYYAIECLNFEKNYKKELKEM
jgi:hypothetical protein